MAVAMNDALVKEFIEKMSGDILEDRYRPQLAELIRGHAGVYALYRNDELYYVGLAANLMTRVNQHLKDHHKGAWDRFSVYLTSKNEHIKPLESLLLRVFRPPGNKQGGKLPGASDRKRALELAMRQNDAGLRARALNQLVRTPSKQKAVSQKKRANLRGGAELAGLLDKSVPLRGSYKGRDYSAVARKNGTIVYAGREYASPTASAFAIVGRNVNGWWFWRYRDNQGIWVRLDELRS